MEQNEFSTPIIQNVYITPNRRNARVQHNCLEEISLCWKTVQNYSTGLAQVTETLKCKNMSLITSAVELVNAGFHHVQSFAFGFVPRSRWPLSSTIDYFSNALELYGGGREESFTTPTLPTPCVKIVLLVNQNLVTSVTTKTFDAKRVKVVWQEEKSVRLKHAERRKWFYSS